MYAKRNDTKFGEVGANAKPQVTPVAGDAGRDKKRNLA